jgi:hypothetical protein
MWGSSGIWQETELALTINLSEDLNSLGNAD